VNIELNKQASSASSWDKRFC